MFFHAYMYGPLQGKLRLYKARDVSPSTVASPSNWVVFASILTRDPGSGTTSGVDLQGFEVKSATGKGAFEYQYHKDSWDKKLSDDAEVDHLFFIHARHLGHVGLWSAPGPDLVEPYFARWRSERPYSDPRRQRFRRSIPQGWVVNNGKKLMVLEDGEVTFPEDAIV